MLFSFYPILFAEGTPTHGMIHLVMALLLSLAAAHQIMILECLRTQYWEMILAIIYAQLPFAWYSFALWMLIRYYSLCVCVCDVT